MGLVVVLVISNHHFISGSRGADVFKERSIEPHKAGNLVTDGGRATEVVKTFSEVVDKEAGVAPGGLNYLAHYDAVLDGGLLNKI